jgi:hypothetical protein
LEISERSKLPVEKVQMVLTLAAQPISLETPIGEGEQSLGDLIEDELAISPMDESSDRELAEMTRILLSTLLPREEKILRLRFGMDGQPAETLEKSGRYSMFPRSVSGRSRKRPFKSSRIRTGGFASRLSSSKYPAREGNTFVACASESGWLCFS